MIIAGSSLRLTITINQDIGSGTGRISYSNNIQSATVDAVVVDSEQGTLRLFLTPAELSVVGPWTVWATYNFEDGRVLITPAKQFLVYAEGTIQS